jgi:putative hydrolase of the HAD superfamily
LASSPGPPYADRVPRREACLVDVYDTLLSCDFAAHRTELPALAGVSQDAWAEGYGQVGAALGIGQLTKAEGFGQILTACGVEARPGLVRALVDKDRELLLASARLYDDAIPFLEALRSGGIRTAIVSNCSEHTRDLLEDCGVAALADTLVLSCEVGAAKPAPEIFRYALDQLGVTAPSALFVDDQPSFCAGGAALGLGAVQIVRGEPDGTRPVAGTTVVRSLPEVEAMLWA